MMDEPQIREAVGLVHKEPKTPSEIFNLTKHYATWEQKKLGVIEPSQRLKDEIRELLTFDDLPDALELEERAKKLASIAKLSACEKALIGGASFIISILEAYLCFEGIEPVFAWNFRNKGKWEFGGFIESVLVAKGWMDQDELD